jgi:hypothetical protein
VKCGICPLPLRPVQGRIYRNSARIDGVGIRKQPGPRPVCMRSLLAAHEYGYRTHRSSKCEMTYCHCGRNFWSDNIFAKFMWSKHSGVRLDVVYRQTTKWTARCRRLLLPAYLSRHYQLAAAVPIHAPMCCRRGNTCRVSKPFATGRRQHLSRPSVRCFFQFIDSR